jgi:hypothetical protein
MAFVLLDADSNLVSTIFWWPIRSDLDRERGGLRGDGSALLF